jgi:hypothetical protein
MTFGYRIKDNFVIFMAEKFGYHPALLFLTCHTGIITDRSGYKNIRF